MTRRLATEVASWRCGLIRGATRPEVARHADAFAAQMATGGKSAAFGGQEAVGGDTERCMMVKSAPGTALEVVEPQLLLEFKIVVRDSPAQLGGPDQLLERRGHREVGQPILSGLGAVFGPFDEQPLLAVGDGLPVVAVGGTHPDVCVVNCYLLPDSTIRPHTQQAPKSICGTESGRIQDGKGSKSLERGGAGPRRSRVSVSASLRPSMLSSPWGEGFGLRDFLFSGLPVRSLSQFDVSATTPFRMSGCLTELSLG